MLRRVMALGALLLVGAICFAQEDIIAEGVGEGMNREEAIISAKRNAVEKGIGTVLLSQTEIENFMLKRDQIITKTVGAVKSYDILSETKSPEGLFEIKIKAALSRASIRQDLAAFHILIESMDKPRVMVIIPENNVGNDQPTNNSAETAIIGFLMDPYGFDLIDPQIVASIKSSQQAMSNLAGNAAEAAALGARHGAEVLITGSAISRKAEALSQNLGGMVSVQADVTLRAINCSSARIIGSAEGHAAKVHISPNTAGSQAIAKAAVTASKSLLDVIIKEWQNQVNNGVSLSVLVKNVATFRAKNAVVQTIQGIAGVSAVRERTWDGQSQVLELDVQYRGNAAGFCDRADGLKMKSGGGSLAVGGVEGQRITLAAQVL